MKFKTLVFLLSIVAIYSTASGQIDTGPDQKTEIAKEEIVSFTAEVSFNCEKALPEFQAYEAENGYVEVKRTFKDGIEIVEILSVNNNEIFDHRAREDLKSS